MRPTDQIKSAVKPMKKLDLKRMSVDELWSLHELVDTELSRKISAEKAELERRLRQLGGKSHVRRPYPQVFPKYRNPAKPSETWAGRGKQPHWVIAQLRSGRELDDFRIRPPSARARHIDRSARKDLVSITPARKFILLSKVHLAPLDGSRTAARK